MQEVFEKIIEKLEGKYVGAVCKKTEPCNYPETIRCCYDVAIDNAIEIVKQEADQYNNGWILCSERMPEEHDSIFVKYKGTLKWNSSMFEKISNEVNVTVSNAKGDRATTHAHTVDGKWSCDFLMANKTYQITAWQPLPEPYKAKGEQKQCCQTCHGYAEDVGICVNGDSEYCADFRYMDDTCDKYQPEGE